MIKQNACIDCGTAVHKRAKRCNPCRYAAVALNKIPKAFGAGRRPMPEDFALYADTESLIELRARYNAGHTTLARWRNQVGASGKLNGLTRLPAPFDIVEVAARFSYIREVARHYGRSDEITSRWLAEVGAKLMPPKTQTQVASTGTGSRYNRTPVTHDTRDYSNAGRAADFLRRYGPVVRCNSGGLYDPKGDHWLRGSTIMSADDVIARAERQGWVADAWRKVA